jgi:MYXO-CTERM domain-containing protein
LFPVTGGDDDGPVDDAVDAWTGETAGAWPVAGGMEFDAGGYWLMGTHPVRADESIKVRVCLGDEDAATECGDPLESGDDDDDDVSDDDDDGCSCSASGQAPGGAALAATMGMAFLVRRRRP